MKKSKTPAKASSKNSAQAKKSLEKRVIDAGNLATVVGGEAGSIADS